MEDSLIPFNEADRMALLHQLDILDTDPEEIYDSIAYIASQICQVPISTITFIDHERQWFKAAIGAEHRENPRDHSFCAHTILGNDILEIPDSHNDERFKNNPLVKGSPYVRFYAGVPLELNDGLKVGTLCVIDNKPHKLNQEQLKILRYLGLQVTKLLELRLKNVLLVEKQETIDNDLNAASIIQKSFLLPSFVKYSGLQIASLWNPTNMIGGDIFNAIQGKEKTIFYMADVCGHDVTSALVTISLSQFFNQHINASTSLCPKEMMSLLNKEYPFERFERFFTVFYLVIDPFTGHFKYSCAGHPPAIIVKRGGGYELLDKGGATIGIDSNLTFEEAEGFLEDGDKVFIYTDGILELEDKTGKPFGANRFYALLESLKNEPINLIVEEINKQLRSFNNYSADDISLLAFEKNSSKETRFDPPSY